MAHTTIGDNLGRPVVLHWTLPVTSKEAMAMGTRDTGLVTTEWMWLPDDTEESVVGAQ